MFFEGVQQTITGIQTYMYCAIATCQGKGEWKGKGIRVSLWIPSHFFHRSLFGSHRRNQGIRVPQEGNVFHTWENEWKQTKSFSSDFPRIPRNSLEFH